LAFGWIAAALAGACGGTPFPEPRGPVESDDSVSQESCPSFQGEHSIFAVFVDGKEIGREVRTDLVENGPYGKERVFYSHLVTRMKMGNARFETRVVKAERTLADSGILLWGAYVSMDQVTARTFLVDYDGQGWERLVDTRSSVTDSPAGEPETLLLSGDEVIGGRLDDRLRRAALGNANAMYNIAYFEPLLDRPIELTVSDHLPGVTEIDGQDIDGTWVEARRAEDNSVVVRAFYDNKGALWLEEYPDIHQVRRRIPGSLTISMETSELIVGLRSDAYISDPNAATRAKFRLTSTPDRLDALDLLSEPFNQNPKRTAPDEMILEVKAGAPDGDEPPKKDDLGTSFYIEPKAPQITGALRYLKSAGRHGRLSRQRRYNATPAVARASLIRNPKRFWSQPERVAGLMMHYVSALLPDKKHTFSMANALTTLERGAGDCTEHAVLFASLMRAAGIPTRLVAGMQLTRGGMWGYHMWNEYWNGNTWKSIDSSTMTYRPGALYVALGRGATRFSDVRDHLADFMWRTFSGVSFDLVEASNNGELLFLARPRSPDQNIKETALFNAVVLSDRGDHNGAIRLLDENIPAASRSLSVKLMRIELLVRSGRHDEALESISALREQTSDFENTELLDRFELKCLLTIGRVEKAEEVYNRIDQYLKQQKADLARTMLRAEYLFGTNDKKAAVEILKTAIVEHPNDAALLMTFAQYAIAADDIQSSVPIAQALEAARNAARETVYSDQKALSILVEVLLKSNRLSEAEFFLDHALILAPAERSLHELKRQISSNRCVTNGD
jgi:tetratricopeptide (TPR) repeat protein